MNRTIIRRPRPAKPQVRMETALTEKATVTVHSDCSTAVKFMIYILNELKRTVTGKTIVSMHDDLDNGYVSFVFVNKRFTVTLGVKETGV